MDKNTFDEYISDRYQDQISWYGKKAASNKKTYQIFQWLLIILSASVPALVASAPKDNETWKIVTVVVSVVLAIGTAAVTTFKFQENWMNYRSTAERLIQEKFFYDSNVAEYDEAVDRESLFVERVEALIAGENKNWVSTQKIKSKSST